MTRSVLSLLIAAALIAPNLARADATTRPAAYPLKTDVVTGEPLLASDQAIVQKIDGREVCFASQANADTFKAGGEAMQKKMDDAIVDAQKGSYKLDTCPISDEKLGGDMGKPVMYVDRASNTLIELCCGSCLKKVKKDSTEALKKVQEANAKG